MKRSSISSCCHFACDIVLAVRLNMYEYLSGSAIDASEHQECRNADDRQQLFERRALNTGWEKS